MSGGCRGVPWCGQRLADMLDPIAAIELLEDPFAFTLSRTGQHGRVWKGGPAQDVAPGSGGLGPLRRS